MIKKVKFYDELVEKEKYEFFKNKEVRDINNKKVTIPESEGCFSLDELEYQKSELLKQVEEIDEKIKAIKTEE